MAGISLVQSAKMTNDVLQAGVIEVLATESKLLQLLPFMNVQGSGYTYNIEKNLGSAQFRKVNDGYTNAAIETIPVTERIVILGDEAIVDTYQIAVESDINNLMAIEVQLRTKAIARKFELVAAVEKNHEQRYLKLLSNIENNEVFNKDESMVWVCRNCGHVHVGKMAPKMCPTCDHPQAYFEVKNSNY